MWDFRLVLGLLRLFRKSSVKLEASVPCLKFISEMIDFWNSGMNFVKFSGVSLDYF